MDKVLKLLKEELGLPVNVSHQTILSKYAKDHLKYDYYLICTCKKELLFAKKENVRNRIKYPNCKKEFTFKEYAEENDYTCSFSIKGQVEKIAKILKKEDLFEFEFFSPKI